ncbi:hypothetical protein PRK78_002733 [Emydomyces testavorans]|uniref:Protein kinase domain-containing protein n=1 Tax=Emydomyces testavorans TaxID=2070801 RepID=A0AAF0IHU2_9EURO|nr:hypothetical protein PRK78_002733 [Emydomyces testavorans]
MKNTEEEHEGAKHVRRVLDWFEVTGPHGKHQCLLHEPTGIDITTFIHRLEGAALHEKLARITARLMLMALDYLHKIDIVHTGDSITMENVQPNNILLDIDDDSILAKLEDEELEHPVARKSLPDRTIYLTRYMPITSGEPILCDMGEARIAHGKQEGLIMPSIYRAPEVLLGMSWDSKVDIWGLAQTIWSIFEGDHLFRNVDHTGELDPAQRFAEMTALMGPPPHKFIERSKEGLKYWDEKGQ